MNLHTCITALRFASTRIDWCENNYICSALHAVSEDYPDMSEEVQYLKTWVQKMLGSCGTLESWLRESRIHLNPIDHPEKLRVTRLAWIDWMIAELEKEL